ncbi:MAG: hypothetical protein JWM82_525 [Myxococcales bacterium]|nr:hypothetical protein [Myxococcales bacterium]
MSTRTGLALVFALGVLGCGGASPTSGVTAYLRASNGQYVPGELSSTSDAMTPTVDLVKSNNTHVFPGALNRTVSGSANPSAKAVLLGLEGDSAHWLIPVGGVVDINDVPGDFLFTTSLSFSPDLPPGDRKLFVRAVDKDGVVGPAQVLALEVDSSLPLGVLVVDLEWDTQADLDLHVHITPPNVGEVLPNNTTVKAYDVTAKTPTALPPGSHTQAEYDAAGKLQLDSNARCTSDGQHFERLLFDAMAVPPTGTYDVRIDTFSLCGESTARWHVQAYTNTTGTPTPILNADGLPLEAYGQSVDRDTVGDHGASAGVWALSFEWPLP